MDWQQEQGWKSSQRRPARVARGGGSTSRRRPWAAMILQQARKWRDSDQFQAPQQLQRRGRGETLQQQPDMGHASVSAPRELLRPNHALDSLQWCGRHHWDPKSARLEPKRWDVALPFHQEIHQRAPRTGALKHMACRGQQARTQRSPLRGGHRAGDETLRPTHAHRQPAACASAIKPPRRTHGGRRGEGDPPPPVRAPAVAARPSGSARRHRVLWLVCAVTERTQGACEPECKN